VENKKPQLAGALFFKEALKKGANFKEGPKLGKI
jgi:hypothetical protein